MKADYMLDWEHNRGRSLLYRSQGRRGLIMLSRITKNRSLPYAGEG